MKRGKLIVFEGVSGTGKETQAKLLQKFLSKKHIKSRIVFHPTPEMKDILRVWRKERDISSKTETFLLIADRISRIDQVIKPALLHGEWVISLRNWVSAAVYQGYTGNELKKVEPTAFRLYLFDIDPSVAMKRVLSRGETLGKFETPKLLEEKRNIYRRVLRSVPHIFIDAGRSIDEIHREVVKYI